MKALSVKQPWAWWMFNDTKATENRRQRTRHRGPLLIHASKALDEGAMEGAMLPRGGLRAAEGFGSEWRIAAPPSPHERLARGKVVGVVTVVGCDRDARSAWDEDDLWHWRFEEPLAFPRPLPWRGALGLWDLPDEEARALLSATQGEAMTLGVSHLVERADFYLHWLRDHPTREVEVPT